MLTISHKIKFQFHLQTAMTSPLGCHKVAIKGLLSPYLPLEDVWSSWGINWIKLHNHHNEFVCLVALNAIHRFNWWHLALSFCSVWFIHILKRLVLNTSISLHKQFIKLIWHWGPRQENITRPPTTINDLASADASLHWDRKPYATNKRSLEITANTLKHKAKYKSADFVWFLLC